MTTSFTISSTAEERNGLAGVLCLSTAMATGYLSFLYTNGVFQTLAGFLAALILSAPMCFLGVELHRDLVAPPSLLDKVTTWVSLLVHALVAWLGIQFFFAGLRLLPLQLLGISLPLPANTKPSNLAIFGCIFIAVGACGVASAVLWLKGRFSGLLGSSLVSVVSTVICFTTANMAAPVTFARLLYMILPVYIAVRLFSVLRDPSVRGGLIPAGR